MLGLDQYIGQLIWGLVILTDIRKKIFDINLFYVQLVQKMMPDLPPDYCTTREAVLACLLDIE